MLTYIDTKSTDAAFNLAAEYFVATERADLLDAGEDKSGSVFMLWRTTPTLMLGKYQNVYEEINLPFAKEHGVKLVRRLSGGGTIYTDLGGAQYTFITRGSDEICFSMYTQPIKAAISALVEGESVAFSGRNDLTIGGKKFSGNAQYKIHNVTVHHGSLLFDTDLAALTGATLPRKEKLTSKSIKSVRERVTNISCHTPGVTDTSQFVDEVLRYINPDATIEFTQAERDRITELMPMINGDDVIMNRGANFSAKASKRFSGGFVDVEYNVLNGNISEVRFSGDFFCATDVEKVERALTGVPPRPDAVIKALSTVMSDNDIYRVSIKDLAELFE